MAREQLCFFIIHGGNIFFTDKGYGTLAAFTVMGWIISSGFIKSLDSSQLLDEL